jgi:hypothetical protein
MKMRALPLFLLLMLESSNCSILAAAAYAIPGSLLVS